MHRPLSFWLRGLVHVAVVAAVGYWVWHSLQTHREVAVTLQEKAVRVTGPYSHDNLAVYLIHSDSQDERSYITLQEGLDKGLVKVSEKADSQVSELQIDNQSDQLLFLQEGDRLSGGQQDRTIYASHVVPARSGPQALPAFCIEPSRWNGSKDFRSVHNAALAPQEVRFAAKYLNSQGEVWNKVAEQRQAINANVDAVQQAVQGFRALEYKTTSLNEALDAAPIKKLCDDFATALDGVVQQHGDAVGVAIVINGQLQEINVYPNHQLLGKQYPRLVQSYALQAVTARGGPAQECSALEIARLLAENDSDAADRAELLARGMAQLRQIDGRDEQTEEVQGQAPAQQMEALTIWNGARPQTTPHGGRNVRGASAGQPAQVESRMINIDNGMKVYHNAYGVSGKTEYKGKTVHEQLIPRMQPSSRPQPSQVSQPRQNDVDNVQQLQRQVLPQQQPAPNQ